MNQDKIGKLIRELRVKNGFTQQELADKLGVTYQAVSKWENGKNIPDISLLKDISNLFNIDINYLLDGRDVKKKNNYYWLIIPVVLLVVGCILFFNRSDDFMFKNITTTCDSFKISGSIAHNSSKSSIYISQVEYCGGDDKNIYNEITSTLIKKVDNIENILEVSSANNVTLEDYLKSLSFRVNSNNISCSDNLYIRIEAKINESIVTYKIPLKFVDNCY